MAIYSSGVGFTAAGECATDRNRMKISYDLRFAHLPCGSWPYVCNAIKLMSAAHPNDYWRVYYNDYCPSQRQIVDILKQQEQAITELAGHYEFQPVKHTCLSWQHHLEFARCRDDSSLYHYLHFDMPLGMKGLPLVVTVHDLYPLVLPGYCGTAKQALFRFIAGTNMKRAGRVITVSQCTRDNIVEHFGIAPEKITVINQGYSPEFTPMAEEAMQRQLAGRYALPERFMLYTGNHKPHKNLARLLHAYSRLPVDLKKRFALVLTGPVSAETGQLRSLAAQRQIDDSVYFLGMVPFADLAALYNRADLFVLPSLYEGFGIPLVESMACGTPVICSNRGAMPEVAGDCARTFDPYQVEEMTAVMQEALEKDVENPDLSQRIQTWASQFTWQKNARNTYRVYEEVARDRQA